VQRHDLHATFFQPNIVAGHEARWQSPLHQ
jgi:hypothetical protein